MKWFKFYGQDFLTDSRVGALHPLQKLMWVALLCVASQDEERTGIIKFLTEDRLMDLCGISLDGLEAVGVKHYVTLETFCNMGLVSMPDKDTLIVTNFHKKQTQQSTSTERVAAFRARKQAVSQDKPDVTKETRVTLQSNGRIEKNRIDNISVVITPEVSLEREDRPTKIPKDEKALSLVSWAEERRGFPFTSLPSQLGAIGRAKRAKITPARLKERWIELENETWRNGFDWVDVVKSFDKRA